MQKRLAWSSWKDEIKARAESSRIIVLMCTYVCSTKMFNGIMEDICRRVRRKVGVPKKEDRKKK